MLFRGPTAAIAFLAALSASMAHSNAEPKTTYVVCDPRAEVEAALRQRYGDAPIGLGVAVNGAAVALWRSAEDGSWAIVATSPAGESCILSLGDGPFAIEIPGAPDGRPA